MPAPAASYPAIPAPPPGRFRWAICALLFFVITINYVDRQVIGVLKPVIETDMGWSEVDYGNIVTAFQASYGIGLFLVGRWLDRVGTRRGLAIAIALWSLAAVLHAGPRSRISVGVGKCVSDSVKNAGLGILKKNINKQ